jgi:hypothetical protein
MRQSLGESWLYSIIISQLCVIGMQACEFPRSTGLHLDLITLRRRPSRTTLVINNLRENETIGEGFDLLSGSLWGSP